MHPNVKDNIPILIIHGLRESASQLENAAKRWTNIKVVTPHIKDRYGVHHSKVLRFIDWHKHIEAFFFFL